MRKFGDLTLTEKQEAFVDEWMFKWGVWVNSGRIDKRGLNIIAKLMQSVVPAELSDAICTDEEGMMISEIVEQFFAKNDRTLHYIVFAYYVNKATIHRIAVKLRENSDVVAMRPCNGKSNVRIPSLKTFQRNIEKELILAKAIIHELLLTGFVILRKCGQNAENIKIRY